MPEKCSDSACEQETLSLYSIGIATVMAACMRVRMSFVP
ncbi:hypothetical protein HMPREF1322_1711 [Porphyromonas gingivalis W50]|nr:hypothetical protein HMPREF1322_1711 [Porphyromonas gingivalis W50]